MNYPLNGAFADKWEQRCQLWYGFSFVVQLHDVVALSYATQLPLRSCSSFLKIVTNPKAFDFCRSDAQRIDDRTIGQLITASGIDRADYGVDHICVQRFGKAAVGVGYDLPRLCMRVDDA